MVINKVNNLLNETIPMIILFIIMAFILKLIIYFYGHKKGDIYNEFKFLIYIIYCFILFELVTSNDFESYSNNFILFKEITRYKINSNLFWLNVIGNILIFLPYGYIVSDTINIICKKDNFILDTLVILITSCCIETIQMFIGRSFDVDDILLNVIGGIIGIIIFKIVSKLFRWRKKDE